eukprot:768578-Hanusia_phi.AAC.7
MHAEEGDKNEGSSQEGALGDLREQEANNAAHSESSSQSDELEDSEDATRDDKEQRGGAGVDVARGEAETAEQRRDRQLKKEERLLRRMFHAKEKLLREQQERRLRTQQLLEELGQDHEQDQEEPEQHKKERGCKRRANQRQEEEMSSDVEGCRSKSEVHGRGRQRPREILRGRGFWDGSACRNRREHVDGEQGLTVCSRVRDKASVEEESKDGRRTRRGGSELITSGELTTSTLMKGLDLPVD